MAAPHYTAKDDSNHRRSLLPLAVTKVSARQLLLTLLLVDWSCPPVRLRRLSIQRRYLRQHLYLHNRRQGLHRAVL